MDVVVVAAYDQEEVLLAYCGQRKRLLEVLAEKELANLLEFFTRILPHFQSPRQAHSPEINFLILTLVAHTEIQRSQIINRSSMGTLNMLLQHP